MVYHGHSLAIADIDEDGHLDIFNGEMGVVGRTPESPATKMRVLYGDGQGNFIDDVIATGYGNHESHVGDLDGDGDLDIAAKPYNWRTPRMDVWLNNRKNPTPATAWKRHLIDPALPAQAVFVKAADLNGDGRIDLAAGGWWYEHPGALGGEWSRREIGAPLNNMIELYDFDEDGDIDILGTQGVGAARNADLLWARNDGKGAFEILQNVSQAKGDFVQGIATARFLANGPIEVALSWHKFGEGAQMLTVPADPAKDLWPWRCISPVAEDEDLSLGDIDGDGDLDLYCGTMWLENPGSADAVWPNHKIGEVTMGIPDRNSLADFNGNGRLDAVVGEEKGTDILLFLSPEDPKKPWARRIIAAGVGGGFSMDEGDIDNDGDTDIVLGEHRSKPKPNRLIFYENDDSADSWLSHVIDAGSPDEIDHHDGSTLVDMDGDGDLDVISVGWYNPKVWIFENPGK
ncbi:MAG: FG-GAP repeat protein [candidate division BRC1 bacterium ADurb.BinA364]|nr:MAG: FG-GAP repeat protein [candidate division BRC1 bacterium ADurb.BinA364]